MIVKRRDLTKKILYLASILTAGLLVRRKHNHKPRVNRDDTSITARSFFLHLCLRRPGSHVAYAALVSCRVVELRFVSFFFRWTSLNSVTVRVHSASVDDTSCRVVELRFVSFLFRSTSCSSVTARVHSASVDDTSRRVVELRFISFFFRWTSCGSLGASRIFSRLASTIQRALPWGFDSSRSISFLLARCPS